jgi:quinolinate synthase
MKHFTGQALYTVFRVNAADIYPGRCTLEYCERLAAMANEALELLSQKRILLLVHNYQYPELQELARAAGGYIGDSYGLTLKAKETDHETIAFCSVAFMAETVAILLPGRRVLIPARPGCSLADPVDVGEIRKWRARNPGGKVVSYINTKAEAKAESDYICTSRNAPAVVAHVRDKFPNTRIYFLPDKYLAAHVMRKLQMSRGEMDVWEGACHVHKDINEHMIQKASDEHSEAELLIHPECGCTSACLARIAAGASPGIQFLSTEGMLNRARESSAKEFIVATEAGIVYRLRREIPQKIFYPVVPTAHCKFMKEITLENLLGCLKDDRNPALEVGVPPEIANKARRAIEEGMKIQ